MDERRLSDAVDAPVRVFEAVPNTTDWVRRRGFDGAPHGTFAVAESLTAAVGRTGDDWQAPPGGVWSSTLLRPALDAEGAGRLTVAGGLAALDAVRSFGVDAGLKWPNDVVVPGDRDGPRKLAGVLVERVIDEVPVAGKSVGEALGGDEGGPDELQFVVVGAGINADLDPDRLDVDGVTTMRAEVGSVDPTAVAAEYHDRLLARAAAAESEAGFADLLADWRAAAGTLGERVRVRRRGDAPPVVGRARDVGEGGELLVETDDGKRVAVRSGDCERLRRD